MKTLATLLLLACMPLAASCNRAAPPAPGTPDASGAGPTTALGRTVQRAMGEAREKLATENISLNGEFNVNINGRNIGNARNDGKPKAEITPQGDLLIEGKAVAIDAGQRKLVQAYRAGIVSVAQAGMDIGVRGADLGMKAAGEAISGIFSGNTDDIEKRIEAEAAGIKASARQLCDRLPALLSAQDALAASVPEFKPYATMVKGDVDDCYEDNDEDKQGGVQVANGAGHQNAAQEAETAAKQ